MNARTRPNADLDVEYPMVLPLLDEDDDGFERIVGWLFRARRRGGELPAGYEWAWPRGGRVRLGGIGGPGAELYGYLVFPDQR